MEIKKNNILSVDATICSEDTLKVYANMWYRFSTVPQPVIEAELKAAKGKAEVIGLIKKYYGDMVDIFYSEEGDLR